jgi:hypothetical protein
MPIPNKATVIVHWPGQDTAACDVHAQKLAGLASVMGFNLTSTAIIDLSGDGPQCTNCVNEEKKAS